MRIIIFALSACLLLPAASAENTVDYAFAADYKSVTMKMAAQATGQDAQQIREAADQMGNNDGTASQAEIDSMINEIKDYMQTSIQSSMSGGNFTLDGKDPTSVVLNSMKATNGAGSVSSTATITMTLDAKATYVPAAGTTHTLISREGEPTGSETGTITIRAGSGSIVKSATGASQGTINSNKTAVTYTDSATGFPDATITFGPKSTSSSSSTTTSKSSSSSSTTSKASTTSPTSAAKSSSATSGTTSKTTTKVTKASEKSSPDAGLAVLFALMAVAAVMQRRTR